MMNSITRRQFLYGAAGAGAATGLFPKVRRVLLEPFVEPPEEALPGKATWYASSCRQCPAGCGIIVRVINGRARKIEGNPAHPLNRGKLCARGQSGLQVLYNPDRITNVLRQRDGRGSRNFEPIYWEEALLTLTDAFTDMADLSRVAFLGNVLPEHLNTLVRRFMDTLGAPPAVIYDLHSALEGRAETAALSQRWFNSPYLPIYDIDRAEVIFSFGANLLETWMSPVAQNVGYGAMRSGEFGGRGLLVQFEPRLSATGASADEWIPVRPGMEGLIAQALGRIIVEEDLGQVGSHREHAPLYRNVNVGDIAATVEIPVDTLYRLARVFANANRSVAIPGGYLSGMTNQQETADAIMALNRTMRRFGREGGVFLPLGVPNETFQGVTSSSSDRSLFDLIDRMRSGQVEILFIYGSNPLYDLPSWMGFGEALNSVPLVVNFNAMVDETAAHSDLVLPTPTYLESWGYQVVSPGADRPAVSGMQPVVEPMREARSVADVLLALSNAIGGSLGEALPWSDEVEFLEQATSHLVGSSVGAYDARTPAGFWSRWRQHGGWWSEKPIRQEPDDSGFPNQPLSSTVATFAGDAAQYPYYLMPYENVALSDGRGASQPWLQETPDPMTTARWSTWVELNPTTADLFGLENNDLVRVISPHGELEAPVVVYPGIRPDVVAIPVGQGHSDYGRFAMDRGSNVMKLIAPVSEGDRSDFPWASTRVRLEPVGIHRELARLESLDGEGRETLD